MPELNNTRILPIAIGCTPHSIASYRLILNRNSLLLAAGIHHDGTPVIHVLEPEHGDRGYTYVWVIPAFLAFRKDSYHSLGQNQFIGAFVFQETQYYVFSAMGEYQYNSNGDYEPDAAKRYVP